MVKKKTIKEFVRGYLRQHPIAKTQSIINAVRKKYPDSAFGEHHVGVYKAILRKEGEKIQYRYEQ